MNSLRSGISQWITPSTSHQTHSINVFSCGLGFAWGCVVTSLSVQLLLLTNFEYRHHFSSGVTTLFSQSKQRFLGSNVVQLSMVDSVSLRGIFSKWCKITVWPPPKYASCVDQLQHSFTNGTYQIKKAFYSKRVEYLLTDFEVELASLALIELILNQLCLLQILRSYDFVTDQCLGRTYNHTTLCITDHQKGSFTGPFL